jgi:hypothetical protein
MSTGPSTTGTRSIPRLTPLVESALAVAAAIALRLPFLAAPARPDEAGYLLVAAHAHPGGPFLYGDLWVDRPPLLIAFFALAHALGGIVAARVLILGPVAVLVLAAASAGARLGGPAGRRSAAAVAAALSATPLLAGPEVDGELLAAPLVMLSAALGLTALVPAVPGTSASPAPPRRVQDSPALALLLAGVCGAAAVLVKQNFVDALVLLGVLVLARALRRDVPVSRAAQLLAALVAGALVPVLLTVGWAYAWGSDLRGLYEPIFAFRSQSLQVIADSTSTATQHRAQVLLVTAVASGLLSLIGVQVAVVLPRLRDRDPLAWALLAMLGVGLPAIALGGSYWTHYLLQLVPVAALGAGVLAGRRPKVRAWGAATVALAVVSTLVAVPFEGPRINSTGCRSTSGARTVGRWLASASQPGDSVVVAYGGADITYASGLQPAQPYLWSLPIRTLDPHLTRFAEALDGPGAATWAVPAIALDSWSLENGPVAEGFSSDYRTVATVCGLPVLLRDDLQRPLPPGPGVQLADR